MCPYSKLGSIYPGEELYREVAKRSSLIRIRYSNSLGYTALDISIYLLYRFITLIVFEYKVKLG